ncbi:MULTISPECIES: CGNR zinc finger domain-containing protein [unclassified Arthrobacter]|uniref:CGNR zinc finger domain-containing protein n=1 Tax=unclassified Arthrobacter TaxID=235627 RepID=UPI001E4813C3|nr:MULTISPECIES: CGNR zinc finger domain-containing protein [unclassified Arthrobacter]MCC9145589.1 CGNR zinc finger domain-containing protein [Arthrobacter sp. zg-Y919]MDK1276818.1 CGNR zinc finger domain-containing protein [Arthrobacter sp. zg.Y919]WIB04244.1 CGNR zinc finger domain-containing protein [Arthrobacter sp. zg-Y919]
MNEDLIEALVKVARTRAEGQWPEQLDLDVFHRLLEAPVPAAVMVDDVAVARHIRDVVAAVLVDGTDAEARSTLNSVAETYAIVPRTDENGLYFLSLSGIAEGALWAQILADLMQAVSEGCRDRIGRCVSAPCIAPFLDTSTAGVREFCSTRCATRARVRRHRSKVSSS